MKRLIEYPVEGEPGQTIVVEVDEPQPELGEERAARRGEIERAERTLENALEQVKPATRALVDKLRSLAEPPDEYTIEFGIKLTGKANVVVASAAAEANYRVTMTWRRT